MAKVPILDADAIAALRRDHHRLRLEVQSLRAHLRAYMNELDDAGQWRLGIIHSTIAANTTGEVEVCNDAWDPTGVLVTVKNYHLISLVTDLRVRWGRYPGWKYLVVEPFHHTVC